MTLDFCHLSQEMDGFELVGIFTMDLPDLWSTGFLISQTPMPQCPDASWGFHSAHEDLNPVQLLSNRRLTGNRLMIQRLTIPRARALDAVVTSPLLY